MIGIKKLLILSSISVLLGFGKNIDIFEPIRATRLSSTPAQLGCLLVGE